MSCLCIGGVCIPYAALFPALIIALQWIASQFARVGLLPDFIAKRLGLASGGKKAKSDGEDDADCKKGCCGSSNSSNATAKNAGRSDSVATTAASVASSEGDGEVEHVDGLRRWEELFAAHEGSTLFVKFTADWCKPCKAIQPAYVSLASKYARCTFVTLDIDGDDCDVVSAKMKVAMMPTFVCLQNGVEKGRMSGGNSGDKLGDWIGEMCA